MKHKFNIRSLVSIQDLKKEEILFILKQAEAIKAHPPKELLKGKIMADLFFEPSTRTRLSFESAMLRLGGEVLGFSDPAATSTMKGESLSDAVKIISSYADILVLRHPCEGAARLAQDVADKPVINAGDGGNQHPSQTLLDLFSIKECQGKLHGLHLACAGDLKYGRTVHSLALAAAQFDMRLFFVSPLELSLPDEICHALRKRGIKFSFHRALEEVMGKIDILYMTRLQKERFGKTVNETGLLDAYQLKEEMLSSAKKNLKIFHPLPRLNEIDPRIDDTPYAYYFAQAANGLYVRQALLSLLLDKL